jgi:hypothetical protein
MPAFIAARPTPSPDSIATKSLLTCRSLALIKTASETTENPQFQGTDPQNRGSASI